MADKALLPKIDDEFESKVADLKRILVKKLMVLTEGKVSQGVKDYLGAEVIAKGSKFSASDFDSLDFTAIQLSDWTNDDHANGMIRDLILNFIKKYKELDAELKRKSSLSQLVMNCLQVSFRWRKYILLKNVRLV